MTKLDDAIRDAIADLKAEITKQGYKEGIVEDIAREYGLKTVLLRRKFEEATRATPESWEPPQDMSALARKRAKQMASKLQKDRRLVDFGVPALSSVSVDGEECVFCGASLLARRRRTKMASSQGPEVTRTPVRTAYFVITENCEEVRSEISDDADAFLQAVRIIAGPEDF